MSRPPLPVGTWGSITVTGTPGRWRARTRFRDYDGVTRHVERTGPTKGAARNALTAALKDRAAPSGDAIHADTRLSEVASVWLAERAAEGRLTVNTMRRYREAVEDYITPSIGALRLREATVSRLDRYIKQVASDVGTATAKLCSTVLSGVCGLAVRHDAIPANPMRSVAPVRAPKSEPKALTAEDVLALRQAARAYVTTQARGRPRSLDLPDVVDVLLGTGARIGEVLALRWSDVNLDTGLVTVCGTIVMSDGKPSRPIRQPYPKGKRPRAALLPAWALDALVARRVRSSSNPHEAVFPSRAGTWMDPGNLRKTFAKALRGTTVEWFTPHATRRTVATMLTHDRSVDAAAAQLGDDAATTLRHYVEPRLVTVDNREVLAVFAPTMDGQSGNSSG